MDVFIVLHNYLGKVPDCLNQRGTGHYGFCIHSDSACLAFEHDVASGIANDPIDAVLLVLLDPILRISRNVTGGFAAS